MRTFICLISLLIASTPALALEKTRWKSDAAQVEFWVLHQEGRKFMVEHFVKAKGRLQDRVASLVFTARDPAERRWLAESEGFQSQRPRIANFITAPKIDPADTVYPSTNAWSVDWEARYSAWIEQNASSSFLADHGVATDCADVAYAYRWIFARINGLPMANALSGSNDLFTNETLRPEWQSLPTDPQWDRDQRFMAALNYLLENTFTHTLMPELYPIAINTTEIRGGAIFLNLWSEETGHTQLVRTLLANELANPGPLRMLAGDVPRELRQLDEYGFGNEDWPKLGTRGFFRFRWAQKTPAGIVQVPGEQMPDYSLEQFDPSFSQNQLSVIDAVLGKVMPNWNPNYPDAMRMFVGDLLNKLSQRVTIVQNGFTNCQTNDCSPGSGGWETWSTPGRDSQIVDQLTNIQNTYQYYLCKNDCRAIWDSHQQDVIVTLDTGALTVQDFIWRFSNAMCSADPRDPIDKRWGTAAP